MHPDKFIQRGKPQQEATFSSAEKSEKLEALGAAVAERRKEAVDARKVSGIEDVWMASEESYLGIDDSNRAEFSGAKWAKPTSMSGPITSNSIKSDETRSTVFVPMTARYVDGASSKLAEIILPIDDKAFALAATPNPDLVKQAKQAEPMVPQQAQPAAPGQPPMQGQPPAPPAPPTPAQQAQALINQASQSAEKAETRIYDWMTESKYPFEARKVIKDAARLGCGILKGPVPEVSSKKAMTQIEGGLTMQILQSIKPCVKWVDPWNFYPAEGCGENIHDGDGCLERDYLSSRKLKALKKQDGYLKDQIDKVLEDGPGKAYVDGANPSEKKSKNRYEVWYYYGTMSREDMLLTGTISEGEESDKDEFHAIVTLVNDTVIRAIINPLDSGSFPYHVLPWRRRPGHWAGVGVAEQMAVPQRMVNAATRAMLNNAGLSAGPQIIIDELGIVPADNSNKLYPGKIWYKTGESASQDVRQSFLAVMIPSVEAEMMAIIQYGMKLAEEATSIPLIAQGQQGPNSPQTFGAAELQNNNSLTWLRDIGYGYDGYITEPVVDSMYEWLLLDPNVPDDEKGDFSIKADGSAAMVERAIQEQTMQGLLNAVANPAFDLDPAKLIKEYLKSKRLDPRRVQLSDEDKAKRDAKPPQAPVQIQVEQLKGQNAMQALQAKGQAEAQLLQVKSQIDGQGDAQAFAQEAALKRELAQLDAQTTMTAAKMDTDRDLVYVQAQTQRDQTTASLQMEELKIKRELALLDYANKREMSLDQVKASLAKTSMSEQTKRELAQAQIALNQNESHKDRVVDVNKHAATLANAPKPPEPMEFPGRAAPGKAFSQ